MWEAIKSKVMQIFYVYIFGETKELTNQGRIGFESLIIVYWLYEVMQVKLRDYLVFVPMDSC